MRQYFILGQLAVIATIRAACAQSGLNPTPTPTFTPVPTPTPSPTPMPVPTPRLTPRKVLSGNPDRVSARLSADGMKIGYHAEVDGVLNFWAGPVDDLASARTVTGDTGRGIRGYRWASTNDHIPYSQDKAGDENWRLYSVNLSTGRTNSLTPIEGVQARIQQVSPKLPDEILIGLNDRNSLFHELYRINTATGERRLVQENHEFIGFLTVDDYNVRGAARLTPDGGIEWLKPKGEGGREPFTKIPMEDAETTEPIGFGKSGEVGYVKDSPGRNTAALTSVNAETGEQVAVDPLTDLGDVMIHPTEEHVQAAAFTYERLEWQISTRPLWPTLHTCERSPTATSRSLAALSTTDVG